MPDTKLLFGPYLPPRVRRGQILVCEFRGEVVKVGGLTDAPIMWPRVLKTGSPSVIVCGDLVRAIRTESAAAVAYHWGVSETTVWKWRKSLGVERMTAGTKQLYRDLMPTRLPEGKAALGRQHADTPAIRKKLSAMRKGKPALPQTRKGLRRAAKRKWSRERKRARKLEWRARVRAGTLPKPPLPENPWTEKELALLGMMLDSAVSRLTGRSVAAVRSKRQQLGMPMSRHSRLRQEPKKRE